MGVNMDYCKFHNTLRALEQCVEDDAIYRRQVEDSDEIDREVVHFAHSPSPSLAEKAEEEYRKKLISLCREIAQHCEEDCP
jgi:hypothetical protein